MFPASHDTKAEQFEAGSVLKVRYPSLKGLGLTKLGLHSALMHFGTPAYVDV